MSDLVSKVSAGGLSAGVFLLWWPAHVTAQGGEWLFVRGILWSLAFEILLLAFRPLEQAIVAAVGRREATGLGRRGLARVFTVAALGVAVPLVMFAGARQPVARAPARAAAPKVIVKREIVKREVVVRRVNHVVRVPVAAATPAPAPMAASTATRRPSAPAAPAKKRPGATQSSGSDVVATSPQHSATTKTTPAKTTRPAATTPAATETPAAAPAPAAATSTTAATAAPVPGN